MFGDNGDVVVRRSGEGALDRGLVDLQCRLGIELGAGLPCVVGDGDNVLVGGGRDPGGAVVGDSRVDLRTFGAGNMGQHGIVEQAVAEPVQPGRRRLRPIARFHRRVAGGPAPWTRIDRRRRRGRRCRTPDRSLRRPPERVYWAGQGGPAAARPSRPRLRRRRRCVRGHVLHPVVGDQHGHEFPYVKRFPLVRLHTYCDTSPSVAAPANASTNVAAASDPRPSRWIMRADSERTSRSKVSRLTGRPLPKYVQFRSPGSERGRVVRSGGTAR